MLRIVADRTSTVIREGSVLYAYCIRTVSVDFRPIHRNPQPDFESDFMFHVCCGLSQSVLAPCALRTASAGIRTLSTASVFSPWTKLRCRSPLFCSFHCTVFDSENGLGELPKIWGFLFNIYTMAEASVFKFGTQLAFVKAHHKITPRGKSWRGLRLGEFLKILGSPIIFLQ